MALTKQLIDIPLTTGIDTKTDSVNDTPPQVADLNNLRFTHTGAYDPRTPFTATQALTATETGFVVEARDGIFSSVDANLYKTTASSNTKLSPVWSPTGTNYIIGGNYTPVGGGSVTSRITSVTLTNSSVFHCWYTPSGLSYQFMSEDGELLVAGQQTLASTPTAFIVTAGPSNDAFIWLITSGNVLAAYRVSLTTVTALTVPSVTTMSRLVVTYSATDTCWYAIYMAGSNTTAAKYTLSGSTITAATTTTLVAATGQDVDIIRTTNYVVAAYWTSTTITVNYLNTSLVSQATQTRTPSVTTPDAYVGFGICETTADTIFCSVCTVYYTSGPVLHAFRFTTSSAANVWDASPIGFLPLCPPVYVNSRIYVSASDYSLPGSCTMALMQIADYSSGATESALEAILFWGADAAVVPDGFPANFATPQNRVKYRIAKTSSVIYIPYHVLGGFTYNSTTTTGNTAGIPSTLIDNTYVVGPSLAATMRLSLTDESVVRGIDIASSSVITTTAMRSVDGAGTGPGSAWSLPTVYQRELVTFGGSALNMGETYTYVFVKVWSDSQGNKVSLETLPIVMYPQALGVNYNAFKFYFPPSAFAVYNTVTSGQDAAAIEVYRTEGNGTIPYYVTTLTESTSMPYTDSAQDSALVFQLPLPSSSGELTSIVPPASRASTVWKGRLAILPYDTDRTVMYTKPVENLAFPAFAAGLEISFAQTASPLTALGTMDGVLYAFTKNEVYTVYGDPAGATGEGGTLTLPEIRFNGVGCSDPASVILTPKGLFFKSDKGIYTILRNQELVFVGTGPFDSRTETVVGTWASETTSEVAFALDNGEIWVYDWEANGWSRWTPPVGTGDAITGACLADGIPTYITNDGIYQTEDGGSETYPISVTTAWIRLGELQGYQRVYNTWLYMEKLAAHTLTVDLYINSVETSVYTWTIDSETLASSTPEQIRLSMPIQKCSSFKLKISSTNAGWKLKGLTAEIGVKDTAFKSRNTPNNY